MAFALLSEVCRWCSSPCKKNYCSDKCRGLYCRWSNRNRRQAHQDKKVALGLLSAEKVKRHRNAWSGGNSAPVAIKQCVICLYRAGFGCRTIAARVGRSRAMVAKWWRKSPHYTGKSSTKPCKVISVEIQQAKSRATKERNGTWCLSRSRGHGIKYACTVILEEYRRESRAIERPELAWARLFRGQTATERRRQQDYQNVRMRENPVYRAMFYARKRIRNFIKQKGFRKNGSPNSNITAAIGCSPQFLRDHLERQFKFGMSWKNHGRIWHIDHVTPLASATTVEQVLKLAHWTNLQPLLVTHNLAKGDKILTKAELISA